MFNFVRYCTFILLIQCVFAQHPIEKLFENCHKNSTNFDSCIKTAFNDLRVHFKAGLFLFILIFVYNYCMVLHTISFNYWREEYTK